MFFGLWVFRLPLSPCLSAKYRSSIHIQVVGAWRWSVLHPKPRPEPDFIVAHLKMGVLQGNRSSGSSDAPFSTISTLHLAPIAPPPKRNLAGVRYSTRILIRVPNFMATDMKMGSR